jgi:hypothetical protein
MTGGDRWDGTRRAFDGGTDAHGSSTSLHRIGLGRQGSFQKFVQGLCCLLLALHFPIFSNS